MKYYSDSVKKTYEIARSIMQKYADVRIFLLMGDLGSGKTTFVKGFIKNLGCNEDVTSPTFTIVQEYNCDNKVYHIDLYRLKDVHETINIGIDEYLNSGRYVFIEWPDLIIDDIDSSYLIINFKLTSINTRVIEVSKVKPKNINFA